MDVGRRLPRARSRTLARRIKAEGPTNNPLGRRGRAGARRRPGPGVVSILPRRIVPAAAVMAGVIRQRPSGPAPASRHTRRSSSAVRASVVAITLIT